jgi:crossover junction endodeoxyribonuclease RuvC
VRIFGIDPGSVRTGYGCVDSDGSRHRLVTCGAIAAPSRLPFPERLLLIHTSLVSLIAECRPDGVAVESLFHAVNARSALQLGHARGVALLAASQAGLTIAEYAPAEVKRAVVGYGRAEKPQVQHMICLLLGVELGELPGPYDASDALAVAICHIHTLGVGTSLAGVLEQEAAADARRGRRGGARGTNWRQFKVESLKVESLKVESLSESGPAAAAAEPDTPVARVRRSAGPGRR